MIAIDHILISAMKKYLGFLCILLLYHFTISAQNNFDSSYQKTVAVYTNAAGLNAHLYNGSEYIDYDHRITGNPFFAALNFTNGNILYDGIEYSNVQLLYDILHDDVVIKNYNGTPLILVKEKVSDFNMSGFYFKYLTPDSLTSGLGVSGYYQVLYDSNTKFFARHKKVHIEKITPMYSDSYFEEHTAHYIFKNNRYYAVSDERSVMKILHDHKNELKKFVRQNNFNFNKNFEAATAKTLAYYDTLINAK